MLIELMNTLLTWLIPLALGAAVLGALLVWLAGRKPPARTPERRAPAHRPAPPPAEQPPAAEEPAPADTHTALAAAPPPAATAPPATTLAADLLLVDDSAVVRAKLRRLFEPAGYRVALARDGEEALALLRTGRYALLITDLEMPRLDGVGLVAAVRGQPDLAAMPILAITGHDDLQAQLNQLQATAGIYRKPWIDEDLLGHVQLLVQPSGVPAAAHAPD